MTVSNFMIPVLIALIGIQLLFTGCANPDTAEPLSDAVSETRVYELRTYTTHEGKLDDLHRRFENHTMAFFDKHGMENIGYWAPESEELRDNTLIYLLAHESREAAEESWASFREDPEWQQVYEASREDGPIVENIESIYMKSAPYSQME